MASFQPTIHPWNQELWQNLTLEPERANHALLFNGDAGLGKKDLAFALAHFVMTDTHGHSANLFDAGSHPDLHVLAPEDQIEDNLVGKFALRYIEPHAGKPRKTITVDQIRKLSAALVTHPHIAKTRLIVIYAAETMNRSASNGLLKSLEEPPQNTLFLIVSDELSKLAKTIRSRCSLVNFKAPDFDTAKAWLSLQKSVPGDEIDNHLAMANNHPLRALELHQTNYIESLKSVFTDVNGLWTQRSEATQVAKNWQSIGAAVSVDILQKLTTDLLRANLSDEPVSVFFPVQKSWIKSVSAKLSRERLMSVIDELIYAKRMLSTTVDELLVLETLSVKFRALPSDA